MVLSAMESSSRNKSEISRIHLKRFLTEDPTAYKKAIQAAETYVSKLEDGDIGWLHSKPFDPTHGNPQYFRLMFDLLNILQALQIPKNGRVLEVGNGPGWVTEILLMLGFSVEALEPSADLIDIAKERCSALASHYKHPSKGKVNFHQVTLEEVEFEEESFDAILFFDVLHHVVDENSAIEKCFKFLKPGGSLGIVEGAWHPEFKALEKLLIDEMARYGTLENPFSVEYLNILLEKFGFIEIERYVAVNGFFTKNQLRQPLKNFGVQPLSSSNNITARKPSAEDFKYPACTDFRYKTDVTINLHSGGICEVKRMASLKIHLINTGETILNNRNQQLGHITLALRCGIPGTTFFTECKERHLLPQVLVPGDEILIDLLYSLPSESSNEKWELDLVSEGLFWFSSRGIKSCSIPINSN
jgi:SAM-dependent methyltransferase